MMHVYRVSTGGYEDYSPTEFCHEKKFTREEFKANLTIAINNTAVRLYEKNSADVVDWCKYWDDNRENPEHKDCQDPRINHTVHLNMDDIIVRSGLWDGENDDPPIVVFHEEMKALGFDIFQCEQEVCFWGMSTIISVEHEQCEWQDGVDDSLDLKDDADTEFQKELHVGIRELLKDKEFPVK